MRASAKKKEGQRHALPPQIFNGEKYCGDDDDFEEFLGIPRKTPKAVKPEEGKEEEKKEGEEEKKPEGEAAPAGEGAPAPAAEGEAPATPAEGEAAPAVEEPAAE